MWCLQLAVLAPTSPDGSEKPIAYASRTLNSFGREEFTIGEGGVSLCFWCEEVLQLRVWTQIQFDYWPQAPPEIAKSWQAYITSSICWVRRWSLYLSQFEYFLKFRGTKEYANADALSRLPLPTVKKEHIPPELVLLTEHLDNSPVTSKQIKAATARDTHLSAIVQYLQKGWSTVCPNDELKPYFFSETIWTIPLWWFYFVGIKGGGSY